MGKVTQFQSDDSDESDYIEEEFKGLINTNKLNQKYKVYKQSITTESNDSQFEAFLKIALRTFKRPYKFLIFFALVIVNLFIINSIYSKNGDTQIISVSSFAEISKTLNHLQFQINEISHKNKNRLTDLKQYIDLKIDGFNNKFIKIDQELLTLSEKNDELIRRIEAIDINDIPLDNKKIPILLDQYNNVKVLPEFQKYIDNQVKSILNNREVKESFQLDLKHFIQNYSDEFLNNKIGFMNKHEILSLISDQFQQNKNKLINELKTLIHKETSKNEENEDQKEGSGKSLNKINYSMASNGARLVNYLTSSSFEPKYKKSFFSFLQSSKRPNTNDIQIPSESEYNTPFMVLTPQETYWKSSDIQNTQFAIKFLEPIYITQITYDHSRPLNGALLTSSPKLFDIYIQSDSNDEIYNLPEYNYRGTSNIEKFIKIGEFQYDINLNPTKQVIELPNYITNYLTKAIIFKIRENHGNEFFTSIYKFDIEGLSKFEIYSIRELMENKEINDSIKDLFVGEFKEKMKRVKIRNVGDDEVL